MQVSSNATTSQHWWTEDWTAPQSPDLLSPESNPPYQPGQHFHMDFRFMRGPGYDAKDKEGNAITSIDGYRSYLLIIDKCSQYTWVFLTKTKSPPIAIIETFLQQRGNKNTTHRTICTDKGGEIWGSYSFQEAPMKAKFILEPTAPNAPSQNSTAERPNQTLSTMARCLLHSANLGHEYWSFALLRVVYLKNRLPHSSINTTPYQKYTGKRPNAKHLRIFGCPIIVQNLGRRPHKLDLHTASGIFLGYTATDKNDHYIDINTKRFRLQHTAPLMKQP
jgi:hypothetical protein